MKYDSHIFVYTHEQRTCSPIMHLDYYPFDIILAKKYLQSFADYNVTSEYLVSIKLRAYKVYSLYTLCCQSDRFQLE